MNPSNRSDADDQSNASLTNPWALQQWAYETQTGSPTKKALLMALALQGAAEFGRVEVTLALLSQWVEIGISSISRNLRELEAQGLIAIREQHHLNGGRRMNEYLLLAPWVSAWPDGSPARTPFVNHEGPPSNPLAPPPQTPLGEAGSTGLWAGSEATAGSSSAGLTTKSSKEDRARTIANSRPDGFPEELRPHARVVMRVLIEIAEQHNAREVTARGVGLAIMGNPQRAYVKEAFALASWAQAPPRPIRDVVGTYRTWLGRSERIAGVEHIDGQATSEPSYADLRRREAEESRRRSELSLVGPAAA